jgi:excisionase family DNA binding protein
MRAQRSDDVGLGNLPAFLRVEEVARILRISRSAAYELANAWLATDGEAGLPAVRLGRSLRIPRAAVERLLNLGSDGDDAA